MHVVFWDIIGGKASVLPNLGNTGGKDRRKKLC